MATDTSRKRMLRHNDANAFEPTPVSQGTDRFIGRMPGADQTALLLQCAGPSRGIVLSTFAPVANDKKVTTMKFTPPDHPLSQRYSDVVTARLKAAKKGERGARRRLELLLAAALILEESGIDAVKISSIVKKAKSSRGTFYLYFGNRSDILLTILKDFIDTFFTEMPIPRENTDWKVRNYLSSLLFAELCMYNSKLMGGLYHLAELAGEARALHTRKNIEWMPHLFRAHIRVFGPPAHEADREKIMRELYALRIMAEQTAIERYTGQNPELNALFPTPHDLAETVTNLWIRAVESGPDRH